MKLNTQVIIQILLLVIAMLVLLLLLDIKQVDGYYVATHSRHNHRLLYLILIGYALFFGVPWATDKIRSTTSQTNVFWQKKSAATPPPEAPLDITLDTQLQNPDNDYQFTDVQKSDDNTYVLNYKQKTSAKKVQFKAVDSNKNNILEPDEIVDYRVIDKKP